MKDKTDLGGYFLLSLTILNKRGKGILFKVGKDMTSFLLLLFFVLSLIYS